MPRKYTPVKKQVRELSPNHKIPTTKNKLMYERCTSALSNIRQGKTTIYSYDFDWHKHPQQPTALPFECFIATLPPPPAWLLN
jgi:hypothetical protein